MPEVCCDAALYCDPLDVGSITAGMRRLAEDDALRARLAAGPGLKILRHLQARGLKAAPLLVFAVSVRKCFLKSDFAVMIRGSTGWRRTDGSER